MDTRVHTGFPARQAAAIAMLDGMSFTGACEKHGIDKGQLSRYIRFVRSDYVRKLAETQEELRFWEQVTDLLEDRLDSSGNGV